MSNFDEKTVDSIKRLEREVERLRVKERPDSGSGVTDHGALTGLADNDHPQYRLTADAIDHGALGGLADNDHPQYLLTTAKAADSDKLDNIDSTGFVQTSGNQTVAGVKTFSSIPVLPSSNPTTANQAVRKGFADATYLGIAAKAADSDKLDGLDSTDFALVDHEHSTLVDAWINWTPTVTGWAAGYVVNVARYKLIGKTCFFTVDISGTSNSTAVNIVMPFTSYSGAGDPVWSGTNAYVQDNGTVATTSASRWYIGENSATLIAYTNMSTGTWTASGAKRIRVTGFYEIA